MRRTLAMLRRATYVELRDEPKRTRKRRGEERQRQENGEEQRRGKNGEDEGKVAERGQMKETRYDRSGSSQREKDTVQERPRWGYEEKLEQIKR